MTRLLFVIMSNLRTAIWITANIISRAFGPQLPISLAPRLDSDLRKSIARSHTLIVWASLRIGTSHLQGQFLFDVSFLFQSIYFVT